MKKKFNKNWRIANKLKPKKWTNRHLIGKVVGNLALLMLNFNSATEQFFNYLSDNIIEDLTASAPDDEIQMAALFSGDDFNHKGARHGILTMMRTNSTLILRDNYSQYKTRYNLSDISHYLEKVRDNIADDTS